MCCYCRENVTEWVCFCDYPLAVLCSGECLQKHKKTPGFHFEMKINILPSVTRENFSACQAWLFGLNRAQQAMRKNIAGIEEFEKDIVAVLEQICGEIANMVKEIAALKREYQAAVQILKQALSEMIDSAIGETTAKALYPKPQFINPLSQWIWWGADTANSSDLQLYRTSAHMKGRMSLSELISIEMTPLGSFLPRLPPHLVRPQKHALEISNRLCMISIISKRTSCIVC